MKAAGAIPRMARKAPRVRSPTRAPLDPARAALIEEIRLMSELERRAAPRQMEAWLTRYMGDRFFASPGAFHRALYRDAEDILWRRPIDGEVRDAAAIACPRGHGKTTAMITGLASWVAHEWRNMPHFQGKPPYIVIVSDTVDQAKARLADIRDLLEDDDLLLADYGERAPVIGPRGTSRAGRRQKWTETHLELRDGTIIRAVGFGSKVRGLVRDGRRPSLILADDMENDEAVGTDARRAKLRRWFTRALIPTGIEGQLAVIVVGTILHADSLLARLLSADDFPGWLKRRYAALTNAVGLPDVDGEHVLWPEYWARVMLLARRRKIGTLAFASEYLNQPVDDESSPFRWAWLAEALARGRGRPFLYSAPPRVPFDVCCSTWDPTELASQAPADAYQVVVTAWDLGLIDDEKEARQKDSDYTVGITVGLTLGDRLEVRRIFRGRGLTPVELRRRVISEWELTAADYVVIETNAAQRLHELELRRVPGLDLPLVRHVTDRRKHSVWEGVPGMALMFELGRIDFCHAAEPEKRRLDTLAAELHGLGLEAHDDCVLALWMAVIAIRRWQMRRNDVRRKLIGEPPAGYYQDLFPTKAAA